MARGEEQDGQRGGARWTEGRSKMDRGEELDGQRGGAIWTEGRSKMDRGEEHDGQPEILNLSPGDHATAYGSVY